jgi:bis(5'-nucleosyl)-tetraphosphatase (symmetrical)
MTPREITPEDRELAGPRSTNRRRRIFVGDVHGCALELEDLLAEVGYDPHGDDLRFVGDLVNKGPDSLAVLRRVRDLDAIVVLGNHDLHLLGVADGRRGRRPGDTMADVLDASDGDELLRWLRTRPLAHTDDDTLLVHAGVNPRWTDIHAVADPLAARISAGDIPWDDEDLFFLTRARLCDAAGRRPPREMEGSPEYRPWDEFYAGPRVAVFGHWAMRGLVVGSTVRGLDTGCVYGGRLSAWIAEEDRVVSVPARAVHQPLP